MSKKRINTGKIWGTVFLVAVLGVLLCAAVFLGKRAQSAAREERKLGQVEVTNPDMPPEYRTLAADNSDVFAWLMIPGTGISYPVVQSPEDSVTYLDHNAAGEEDPAGALFTEIYNKKDFTDPDTVIYGNCMEDGSMFRELLDYEDPGFFQEHRELLVYLPDKTLKYRVAATYVGSDTHLVLSRDLSKEENFQKHIEEFMGQRGLRTNVDHEMEITAQDRILSLSTSHPSSEDVRFLVRAVLTGYRE